MLVWQKQLIHSLHNLDEYHLIYKFVFFYNICEVREWKIAKRTHRPVFVKNKLVILFMMWVSKKLILSDDEK